MMIKKPSTHTTQKKNVKKKSRGEKGKWENSSLKGNKHSQVFSRKEILLKIFLSSFSLSIEKKEKENKNRP